MQQLFEFCGGVVVACLLWRGIVAVWPDLRRIVLRDRGDGDEK